MGRNKNKKPSIASGVLPKGRSKHAAVESQAAPDELRRMPKALHGVADVGDGAIATKRPLWGLTLMDQEHAGSWSWAMDADDVAKLLKFLQEMERLTWNEIRAMLFNSKGGSHKKHHSMPADQLCTEAKTRLDEIGLGDQEVLFRFRLGNKDRLWGVVIGSTFYPVWWDKHHNVYPTGP